MPSFGTPSPLQIQTEKLLASASGKPVIRISPPFAPLEYVQTWSVASSPLVSEGYFYCRGVVVKDGGGLYGLIHQFPDADLVLPLQELMKQRPTFSRTHLPSIIVETSYNYPFPSSDCIAHFSLDAQRITRTAEGGYPDFMNILVIPDHRLVSLLTEKTRHDITF